MLSGDLTVGKPCVSIVERTLSSVLGPYCESSGTVSGVDSTFARSARERIDFTQKERGSFNPVFSPGRRCAVMERRFQILELPRERRITMKGGLRMSGNCPIAVANRFDLKTMIDILKASSMVLATEIASTARSLSKSIDGESVHEELERLNIVVSLDVSCTQACGDRFHNGRSRNTERIVCVQKKEPDSGTEQHGDWKRQGTSLHGRLTHGRGHGRLLDERQGVSLHGRLTHGRGHGRLLEGGLPLGRGAWKVVSKSFHSRLRGLRDESTSVGAFCGLAGSPLI